MSNITNLINKLKILFSPETMRSIVLHIPAGDILPEVRIVLRNGCNYPSSGDLQLYVTDGTISMVRMWEERSEAGAATGIGHVIYECRCNPPPNVPQVAVISRVNLNSCGTFSHLTILGVYKDLKAGEDAYAKLPKVIPGHIYCYHLSTLHDEEPEAS